MILKTDKGKTFNANWAWSPTYDNGMMAEIADDRPLSEIAKDFEGVAHMHTSDPNEGERDHDGYTRLTSIARNPQNGMIQIILRRGDST